MRDIEEDNERYKDQIARQASHTQKQASDISKLESKVNSLQDSNKQVNMITYIRLMKSAKPSLKS